MTTDHEDYWSTVYYTSTYKYIQVQSIILMYGIWVTATNRIVRDHKVPNSPTLGERLTMPECLNTKWYA